MALPSGYKRLKYIEATGTQYIDTGFKPNQDTRVVAKVRCPVGTSANYIFGARYALSQQNYSFFASKNGHYAFIYNTTQVDFDKSANTDEPFVIDFNKNVATIGNNSVSGTYATFSAPVNLILFGVNSPDKIVYGSSSIYSCKIYDNGTLVRDFVPCANTAGQIGVWDDVNSVFYGNNGTGTFGGQVEGTSENTLLLLHGEELVDSSDYNRTIINKGVISSYFNSRFGSKSLYFNGSAYMQIPLVVSGDITIDFWVYTTSFDASFPTPVDFAQDSERGITLHLKSSNAYLCGKKVSDLTTQTHVTYAAIPANAWHHVAITRQGTTLKAYTDGVLQATVTDTGANLTRVFIGCDQDKVEFFTGYIDEFRISNTVRWTADFTPPTKSYIVSPTVSKGNHNTFLDGASYEITGGRCLVDGTGHKIKKGRTLDGGTGYDIKFGIEIGDLPVGTSVYTNVNGVLTEFFIVHQGKPSSLYDTSCNGTWLLSKYAFDDNVKVNSSTSNSYEASNMHTSLNNTVLDRFDDIKSAIKTVKIPYRPGYGNSTTVNSGSKGLSTKLFLLSALEVGGQYSVVDGTCLDYFLDTVGSSNTHLLAMRGTQTLSGWNADWWLRTPINVYDMTYVCGPSNFGYINSQSATRNCYLRPALILPFETLVNSEFIITP